MAAFSFFSKLEAKKIAKVQTLLGRIYRMTRRRIEAGEPNVRAGTLLQALVMLQLKDRVIALSERDPLTTLLGRTWIPKRARAKRKPAAQ